MANFALVEPTYNENGEIASKHISQLHDLLPKSWKNVSNFNLHAGDKNFLHQYGWYIPIKAATDFDPAKFWLRKELYTYDAENDCVIESFDLVAIVPPVPVIPIYPSWDEIRAERDLRMKDFEWRYSRYERQVRIGTPTTDNILDLDSYMQALADITLQNIENIVWPEYIITETTPTDTNPI